LSRLDPNVNLYWPQNLYITKSKAREAEHKSIAEIAETRQMDPFDALLDLLTEDPDVVVRFNHWLARGDFLSDDIQAIFLKHKRCMVSLDILGVDDKWRVQEMALSVPNPNVYSGMPRYLRRYVREMKILSFEEAIRRITSLPASKFNIDKRGVIQPGAYADLVVFEPQKIADVKDPLETRHYPKGIKYVLVNGEIVVREGQHTGNRPGMIIRQSH
jgi:N-acyl-D-amino-acid deacylase